MVQEQPIQFKLLTMMVVDIWLIKIIPFVSEENQATAGEHFISEKDYRFHVLICRICWSADAVTDVQTSNADGMAVVGVSEMLINQ